MKIERILLILPNYQGSGPGEYRPLFPPLALTQLAALTPPNIKVEIIDELVRPINFGDPANLVGISLTMSAARPRAIQIAQEFRHRGVPVVFGGVDPTFAFQECAPHTDYIFRGEAEGGWREFIEKLQHDEAPQVFRAKPWPDLTLAPAPRRDLLNPKDYVFFNIVQTGRGCSHSCDFCSVWVFSGHKMRFRSILKVICEIKSLPRGVIILADDNIVADYNHARNLFLSLRPLKRSWFAQADTTLLDHPDLVELAAESGCVVFFIGLESFNPESLVEADKSFNEIGRYEELVKLLHRHGIGIIPAMMFGYDADTTDYFRQCERELHRVKADAPQFTVLTPLPGTKLFYRMRKEGKLIEGKDLSCYDGTQAVFRPAQMTPEELENGVKELYARYYRLRMIIWRLVSDIWFWRHPIRRLRLLGLLFGQFAPRIWDWVKRYRLSKLRK